MRLSFSIRGINTGPVNCLGGGHLWGIGGGVCQKSLVSVSPTVSLLRFLYRAALPYILDDLTCHISDAVLLLLIPTPVMTYVKRSFFKLARITSTDIQPEWQSSLLFQQLWLKSLFKFKPQINY